MNKILKSQEKGRSLLLYEVISKDEIEVLGLELICSNGKEYFFRGEFMRYKMDLINSDCYHLVEIYESNHNKNETKILTIN